MRAFEPLHQDLRYAARTLSRSPGLAMAAVITLALGIGANTAIFSTVDEALLRPLPLPASHQLAQIYTYNKASQTYVSSSYPDYEDFARGSHAFRQISAYVRIPLRATLNGQTELVPTEAVTVNYFSMLQLPMARGRAFDDADAVPGAAPIVLIGEQFWRSHFGADPSAIGRPIVIEDTAFAIGGVVPARYRGANLNWGKPPEIWLPLQQAASLIAGFRNADVFHQRRIPWLVLMGRLQPGATASQAQAELQTIAGSLALAEPATNRNLTARVFEASHAKFWPAYRTSVTESLAVFAVAAALVLLLACANVSNLLLERALGRRREFAIRLAIGAARGRLARQLLTESLLLVLPGIALALAVATAFGRVMLHFPNALGLPLALDLAIERRALAFCAALALAACVLSGLAPALQAVRADVLPSLKESGSASGGRGSDWYRRALVVVQVAFSMILLVAGGQFARSLLKGYSTDLGFRSEGLLTAEFTLPQGGAGNDQFVRSQEALAERLAGMPGIASASLASEDLLSPVHSTAHVGTPGAATTVATDRDLIGAGFFATTAIPLVRGREFTAHDNAQSPPVAIVNQTLAARLWPGADPLGRTILLPGPAGKSTSLQVVGVAAVAKYRSVWEDPQPYLYMPGLQRNSAANYLIVRMRGGERDAVPAIRREWQRLQPRAPFEQFRTGEELLDAALGPQRVAAAILAAFGLLAIVLATVGLYSVMVYWVRRQTREIGIRMAIGARPEAVIGQVLADSLRMTVVGVAAGAAASAGLMRLASSQIKDVSPYDGVTFLAVALLLLSVALAAAVIPARRASRIDPLQALRGE